MRYRPPVILFRLGFITDRRPHSTICHQGPSLSSCLCPYMEQFAKPRHFCIFDACLPVMPLVSPFLHFFPQYLTVQCPHSDAISFGQFNRSCYLIICLHRYVGIVRFISFFLVMLLFNYIWETPRTGVFFIAIKSFCLLSVDLCHCLCMRNSILIVNTMTKMFKDILEYSC